MDSDKLVALALAFPILAATMTPATAQACSTYDCGSIDHWVDLAAINAAKIPSDGVIVLQGAHFGDDAESLPSIALTVTKDGQPIAGALETSSMHGVLVWRPVDPWQPGASHALAGTVTNPEEGGLCGPAMVAVEAMLNIDGAPGTALVPVEFTGETKVQLTPVVSLDTLACCEGATPSLGYGCGGPDVYWDPEECAPTQARGYLSVKLSGTPAASGATAMQIVYTLKVDGNVHSSNLTPEFSVSIDAPFCATIEASDLASGAVAVSEQHCFGAAEAAMLGPQLLDPAEKLQCALEQCATANDAWDPMMCVPLDPSQPTSSDSGDGASDSSGSEPAADDDGAKGCSCDARPTDSAGLLALLGLVGLVRRRRLRCAH